MSREEGRVATLLLKEAFGNIVEAVGSYLIKHGPRTLRDILKGSDLDREQVKKSLCVLIQHQLVTFNPHQGNQPVVYKIEPDQVVLRVQFPRWIHVAKAKFGDAGELIVEDVLQRGHTPMAQTVDRVSERLKEANKDADQSKVEDIVKQQFQALSEANFLVPVNPLLSAPAQSATAGTKESGLDLPPLAGAEMIVEGKKRKREGSATKSKKRKQEHDQEEVQEEVVDAPCLSAPWRVNFDQFQQHLRNQAIICGVAQQVDETAASIMKAVLSLNHRSTMRASHTHQVFTHEIADAMRDHTPKLSREELEQYLKVLVDHQSCFLHKSEDSGGGAYTVNFKNCSEVLCRTTVECIVRERFGSKAFRVFRLLMMKKMLEQKQVSDMAMIPAKEAKEMLYTLLAEGFVSVQEIPKTPDYAPSRTFYLFSVQLLPVAIMVRERCYKALGNLITMAVTETTDNKRLLERWEQHEKQLAEMRKKVEMLPPEEMEEILTPDEKNSIERIKRNINKLEHAQLQLEQTIMTIDNYTRPQP